MQLTHFIQQGHGPHLGILDLHAQLGDPLQRILRQLDGIDSGPVFQHMPQQAADGVCLAPDGIRLPPRRHVWEFGQATDGLADRPRVPSAVGSTTPLRIQGNQERSMRNTGLDQPVHQPGHRLLAQPRPEAVEVPHVLNHEPIHKGQSVSQRIGCAACQTTASRALGWNLGSPVVIPLFQLSLAKPPNLGDCVSQLHPEPEASSHFRRVAFSRRRVRLRPRRFRSPRSRLR